MRISDWSSDVCSSDLSAAIGKRSRLCGLIAAIAQASIVRMKDSGRRSTKLTSSTGSQSPASRSEEHTSELQSLMRISYAVFCLKKKKKPNKSTTNLHVPKAVQTHNSTNRRPNY